MITLLLACHADPTATDPNGTATGTDPTGTDPTSVDTQTTPTADADPDVSNELPPGYVPADPARVIYLGDSITVGYGASADDLAYVSLLEQNVSATWPGFDDQDFETSYPNLAEFDDVSVSGATTDTLLNQQLDALSAQLDFPVSGETVVVFTIGGNDLQKALIPFVDAAKVVDDALANFGDIVDWLQDPAKFPDGVYVYATNVYEPSDGVGQAAGCFFGIDYGDQLPELDRYNATIAAMGADRGFAVVDLHGHFSGHGYNADDPTVPGYDPDDATTWFASDCIHPNDRGHHELRRLFHAAITGQPFVYTLPDGG